MATLRPQVTVFSALDGAKTAGAVVMPHVMMAPVRPDLVRYVHTNQSKNSRQPHGVKQDAGYETSAESWGTGRAVARIPRVSGGGTHRAGQGAFGNMCRGGGMFAPKRTWRRLYRKINVTERRHAVASAIAASAVPGLVMARGHKIDEIREMPVVMSNEAEQFVKTKAANNLLCQLGCGDDLERARSSIQIRAGRGKMRNRRYTCKRGPLIVFEKSTGIHKSFRGIPGVDVQCVDGLNVMKLAPGGTMGRLIVWTEGAFKRLDELFGEQRNETSSLSSYTLPQAFMTNADLGRIINSFEIQSELNPAKAPPAKPSAARNPLNSRAAMNKLNPAASTIRKRNRLAGTPGKSEYEFAQAKKRKA